MNVQFSQECFAPAWSWASTAQMAHPLGIEPRDAKWAYPLDYDDRLARRARTAAHRGMAADPVTEAPDISPDVTPEEWERWAEMSDAEMVRDLTDEEWQEFDALRQKMQANADFNLEHGRYGMSNRLRGVHPPA